MRSKGLTFVEVLLALTIIGIAFGAFLLSQVSSLTTDARTRNITDTKAVAVRVLEQVMGTVLRVDSVTNAGVLDDDPSSVGRRFWFIDYYYSCPTVVTVAGIRSPLATVTCSQTAQTTTEVSTTYTIRGASGIDGEGLLEVEVLATHVRGASVRVNGMVTCYDIYPSPTKDAPAPCPFPTQAGGGR